jgi:twitching motility protein PilT
LIKEYTSIMNEKLKKLLLVALQNKASDLYLSVGCPPSIRSHEKLIAFKVEALLQEEVSAYVSSLLTIEEQAILNSKGLITAVNSIQGIGSLRIKILKAPGVLDVSIRLLPHNPPDLADLKFPFLDHEVLKPILDKQKPGVLLITGKHGSGLTTTLASIVQYINQYHSCSIITIDNQIEFPIQDNKSFVTQIALNDISADTVVRDTFSFARNFKVIVINDLDGSEKIQQLYELARGGNSLVVAGVHEDFVADTLELLINSASSVREASLFQIAQWLLGIVDQCLVTTLDKKQVRAYHTLFGSPAARNLIREDKFPQLYATVQVGKAFGMCTRDNYLQQLITNKVISKGEAKSCSHNILPEFD